MPTVSSGPSYIEGSTKPTSPTIAEFSIWRSCRHRRGCTFYCFPRCKDRLGVVVLVSVVTKKMTESWKTLMCPKSYSIQRLFGKNYTKSNLKKQKQTWIPLQQHASRGSGMASVRQSAPVKKQGRFAGLSLFQSSRGSKRPSLTREWVTLMCGSLV